MRLKNSIDYKRFPEPSRGDWTRFTILVLSATLLGPCSRLRKQLAVFVDRPRRKLAYVRGWAAETDMRAVRPGGCESKGCPDPRGRQEMPQAQRRGISSILTSSSRQTAAHRHPLWTYKTPHLVRQGPISGNGAPQPPAQPSAAVWRRALSWTSFKVILIGREGTFFALIDVNCLITNFYDETHTSMSFVFYESIRICTAYCSRQS